MSLPTLPPVSYLEIPDGPAGIRETLKLMRELVRTGKREPSMRRLALSLVRNVPEKDFVGELEACFVFVQKKIRYTLDINAIETLQAPQVTTRFKAGDCDDKTILLATLLEILGHPCYLCAGAFDAPEAYGHVFLLSTPAGEGDLIALDATEPYPMGWGPPGPKGFVVAPIEED